MRRVLWTIVLCLSICPLASAQTPISYRISFPEPQHHWMQVDIRFEQVPPGALQVHMSRSSPGRYAIHEFAKNVYDVEFDDGSGRSLVASRPNTSQWDVAGHAGTVHARYRVFGDRADGTFLAIDTNHAHINVPAALMWARGLEDRPARVTFDLPQGLSWKVATQLHPTTDSSTFTAANLQYLVDSPIELSNFVLRSFQVGGQTFRIALHHDGSDAEADQLSHDVERLVREEEAVYGELPSYEGRTYTFLADYLPYVSGDGMEHRNSTVMTYTGALRVPDERKGMLSTVAHEFFHCWNVERIRPRSLEPFKLDEANMSGELWLAEGFTNYYESVVLGRTGLLDLAETASRFGRELDTVIRGAGRRHRTAEEMSRMAPFVDAAAFIDPTDFDNTFISYYTWGSAIGLALDLSLRERSGGKISLDDYMRALWRTYGKPGGPAEGLVGRPYTMQDLRDRLADVAGDRQFADDFFNRFIQGHEAPDYEALLSKAGMLLRKRNPGRAWIGSLRLTTDRGRVRISTATIEDTPAYAAGLDRGDEIVVFDGEPVAEASRVDAILERHKPGDRIQAKIRVDGTMMDMTIVTQEDPRLEVVPMEVNRPLTQSERALREAWLGSRLK